RQKDRLYTVCSLASVSPETTGPAWLRSDSGPQCWHFGRPPTRLASRANLQLPKFEPTPESSSPNHPASSGPLASPLYSHRTQHSDGMKKGSQVGSPVFFLDPLPQ